MYASFIAGAGLLLYTFCVFRLVKSLPWLRSSSGTNSTKRCSNSQMQIFVFLGSGGHTGEMLRILENYQVKLLNHNNNNDYNNGKNGNKGCILHVGYSDYASKIKFESFIKNKIDYKQAPTTIRFYEFSKAREVNSNLVRSIFTIIATLYTSLLHVLVIRKSLKNEPHLILLNGPGTCCIIALWFKILEIFDFTNCCPSNIVYVESLARINGLSLTGKILYYLSDMFVVQWPQLLSRYPRSKWFGILT